MLFLCLALSIDYSFFLLTRWQEERQKKGSSPREALETSLTHSGATILVSGGVLVITWLALAFFPIYGLDSVGYCSAVTVFGCIMSNLILLPASLLSFPAFFSRASFNVTCRKAHDETTSLFENAKRNENRFYEFGRLVTRYPYKFIIPAFCFGGFLPAHPSCLTRNCH